ncbi:MAG: hypothetical protein DI604_33255 [Delftia acidovorans]|nr:MAG: hypothetical protein DI604_33255 [Delftia acidovorans]
MTARLIVLNTIAAAALVAAWQVGFVQFAFIGDQSRISYVIAAIVGVGVALAFTGRKAHLMRAAWLCEVLGFVGTLVGITLGLSGADLSTSEGLIAAGNALYAGMGTAFCSTLVGVAGMLWLWAVAQVVGVGEVK